MKQKKPAKEMNRVILTLTYNTHSKAIKKIVEKNFHLLNVDKELGYLFQEKLLILYRRDRNIRHMLVHSKFSSKDVSGLTLPCGRKRCLTCPFVFNEVHTEVNLLLQVVFLVSANMSFIALNVLDVGRFISGKQKGG